MGSYPKSSGRIRLASGDPSDAPLIECRLLEATEDLETMVLGLQETRKILRTEPIASLLEEEVIPGASIESSAALEKFARQYTGISFHPIGTCRMGLGEDSVVAPDLRVHGTENLWVADASIMPDHMSANMNAPCIMIGMKLGKALIARQKR